MKRIMIVAVLAAFAGAAISAFFFSNRWSAEQLTDGFSGQLRTRVTLKAPASGEAIGFRTYPEQGGSYPEALQSELLNGNTDFVKFSADGTPLSNEEYYPAGSAGASRQLRFSTLRAPDGSFISDRSFRPDGTKIRTGQLRTDGLYEIHQFYADGSNVWKHQLVKGQKTPVLEEVFYPSGKLQSLTEINENSSGQVKRYYESGAMESVTTLPKDAWDAITSVYFYPNGQTVRLEVLYQSLGTSAKYYRDNGTLRMTFDEMFSSTGGKITWTFFDSEGNPSYQQMYFIEKATVSGKETRVYRLKEVTELNAKGEATRTITFRGDGQTPEKVVVSTPAGHQWGGIFRTFREDGTLEKEEIRNLEGKVTKEAAFTSAQGVKEVFPAEYLTMPNDELPPPPLRSPAVRKSYTRGGPR